MQQRPILTVSYRVLDAAGHTVEVVKRSGVNKQNLLWQVNRYVEKKYGKGMKIHPYKIVEVT